MIKFNLLNNEFMKTKQKLESRIDNVTPRLHWGYNATIINLPVYYLKII